MSKGIVHFYFHLRRKSDDRNIWKAYEIYWWVTVVYIKQQLTLIDKISSHAWYSKDVGASFLPKFPNVMLPFGNTRSPCIGPVGASFLSAWLRVTNVTFCSTHSSSLNLLGCTLLFGLLFGGRLPWLLQLVPSFIARGLGIVSCLCHWVTDCNAAFGSLLIWFPHGLLHPFQRRVQRECLLLGFSWLFNECL